MPNVLVQTNDSIGTIGDDQDDRDNLCDVSELRNYDTK